MNRAERPKRSGRLDFSLDAEALFVAKRAGSE